MRRPKGFLCFSPAVMLATFVLELIFALLIIARYKTSKATKLAIGMLGLLAIFQIAEFYVCSDSELGTPTWAKIAYVAISFLPAVGIHLVYTIANKKTDRLVALVYVIATLWAVLFAFGRSIFQGYECGGNYVVFQLNSPIGGFYFIYYYIALFVGIHLALKFAATSNQSIARALKFHAAGYIIFMALTGMTNIIYPASVFGLPSVMCGFAVIYAILLTFKVVPNLQGDKRREK
jgi:hypothetical protein